MFEFVTLSQPNHGSVSYLFINLLHPSFAHRIFQVKRKKTKVKTAETIKIRFGEQHCVLIV
jgi:hypothetical protein